MIRHGERSPFPNESRTGFENMSSRLQKTLQIPLVNLKVGKVLHCLIVVRIKTEGLYETL